MVVIAVTIRIESKGPIFFRQKRIGKNKREFYILKFRTMKINTPGNTPTHMLSNPEMYITKIGKFLRKTSLDELPQVFNVLKSEMSFIGPRPALWNQYDLIKERDTTGANGIKPGITGWAQVNGRDEIPIEVIALYDGEYAHKISLWLDIKIIFKTFSQVSKAQGIVEGTNPQNHIHV